MKLPVLLVLALMLSGSVATSAAPVGADLKNGGLPCSSPGRVVAANRVAVVTEIDERTRSTYEPGLFGCARGHRAQRLAHISSRSGEGPLVDLRGRSVAYEVLSDNCYTVVYGAGLGSRRRIAATAATDCNAPVVSLVTTASGVLFFSRRSSDGNNAIVRLQTSNAPSTLDSGPDVVPESIALGAGTLFWFSGGAAKSVPAA